MGWDGMDKIPRDLCKVHDEALCGLSCRARRDAGAFGSRDAPGVGTAMDAYAKRTGRDATHAFAFGDADTILARVAEYVDAGVSKFILRPLGCDDDAILAQTRLLIERVLPRAAARWPRRPKVTTTDRQRHEIHRRPPGPRATPRGRQRCALAGPCFSPTT